MISKNYNIKEFVCAVKGKHQFDVMALAVQEATFADRISCQPQLCSGFSFVKADRYSDDLKQLIDYLRYTVTPKRMDDEVFRLYMENWGNA